MRVTLSVLLFVVGGPVFSLAAPPDDSDRASSSAFEDPVSSVHVREMVQSLWVDSWMGTICQERGAWILRHSDGGYSCKQVPSTSRCRRLTFSGDRPSNAVAFIHTHPNSAAAISPDDNQAARKIGLPMYTLHRSGLWKFDPASGRTTKELTALAWQQRISADRCSCSNRKSPPLLLARKKEKPAVVVADRWGENPGDVKVTAEEAVPSGTATSQH